MNVVEQWYIDITELIDCRCKLALHITNQKLAQARDLLLPRLMNGEIAV
jgi:hypothetical protein